MQRGDEPSFTQPLMYQAIERHPQFVNSGQTRLERGLIENDWPNKLMDHYIGELERVLESLRPEVDLVEPQAAPPPAGAARQVKTAVPVEQLRRLHDALLHLPDGFSLNPKLERAMRRRRQALDALRLDELTIDWALAEQLALASILEDGIAIRLTGEDAERGTFGQRHAVFHDVSTGQTFTPLQALPQAKAAFDIYNGPLTEKLRWLGMVTMSGTKRW
jgi:2-oxoglutarate dehydrogenase E1 component